MKYLLATFFIVVTFISAINAQSSGSNNSVYVIYDSVSIPTRDGSYISATIVRKQSISFPLPAVLFYTTYYQGKTDDYFAKVSADKEYVGIVAYARGIRADLKNYTPYAHEGTDVYDIIEWISNQSWCNGSVGMYGGSYTGFSQWATAKNIHPALKTIVPQVAVMPGFDTPMENNVEMNLGLYWPNDNIYKRQPISNSLPFVWFEKGIAWSKLDSLAGIENAIFQHWLEHPAYDDYWQSLVPTADEYAKINIPVLTTTGYYDGAQIGALQYYKLHTQYNKNANHYFVIGPYDHWGGQRKAAKTLMGYVIDNVANINMMDLAYQWLDYVLKDKPKPEILKDKFNYQVMGSNEWKHAPSLQTINNDTLTFYLHNSELTPTRPEVNGFTPQTVDFNDRENQNNYFTPLIVFDSLEASNGLIFTTKPFETTFCINGSFMGNLSVSINKLDMDVSLALYEQMPDGKYFFLTRYVGRASFAKDKSKRQLLHPHQNEHIPFFNTRFVSKKINPGSRLVVLLNINKHPFEIINYGSGKKVADETIHDAAEPLKIEWHNDSFIQIPVWKTPSDDKKQ